MSDQELIKVDDRHGVEMKQFTLACEAISGFLAMFSTGTPTRETTMRRVKLHFKIFDLCMEQLEFEKYQPVKSEGELGNQVSPKSRE